MSPEPTLDPQAAPSSRPRPGIARSSVWNTLSQVVPIAVNIGLTPFVLSGLGLPRFGLYVLALTIADFLATVDGGLYASAARYFAVYGGRGDRRSATRLLCTLVLIAVVACAVLFSVLYLSAGSLLSLFEVPADLRAEGAFLVQVLALVVGVGLVRGILMAVLNADSRFALTSVTMSLAYVIYAVGVVLTLLGDHGLYGMAVTLLAQAGFSVVVLLLPVLRYVDRQHLGLQSRSEVRQFVGFAGQAQVAGLSELVNTQADALIIGGFLDVRRVALYSVGATFAGQLRRFPTNALAPSAARLGSVFGAHGLQAATDEFGRLQRGWVQVCTGWMAVGAAAAWFGVTAWLGPDFGISATIAVVLVLGGLVRLWTALLLFYCQTIGRPDIEARYGVVTVVLNLALTAALILPFGLMGVVIATALAQAGGSAYLLRAAHSRIEVDVPTFWPHVPWTAAVVAAVVVVGGQLLVRPLGVGGPIGLLLAGFAAAPGLLVYAVLVLGPTAVRRYLAAVVRRLRREAGAPSADGGRAAAAAAGGAAPLVPGGATAPPEVPPLEPLTGQDGSASVVGPARPTDLSPNHRSALGDDDHQKGAM